MRKHRRKKRALQRVGDTALALIQLGVGFFASLLIVDVGARPEPARNAALLVAHRIGARQKPTILAVMPPEAQLGLEGTTE